LLSKGAGFDFASICHPDRSVAPSATRSGGIVACSQPFPTATNAHSHLPAFLCALRALCGELFFAAAGRTNANCWATDLFFMNSQVWEAHWTEPELPAPLHDILAKISEALHDTVRNPEIAKNFACLPEQLLAELNRISTE
jgi:hypothetical protein